MSTCTVSNSKARRPENSLSAASGFGLGTGESSREPYETMQVCPPTLTFLTPRSLSFLASARTSSGDLVRGLPFKASMQYEHPPVEYLWHPRYVSISATRGSGKSWCCFTMSAPRSIQRFHSSNVRSLSPTSFPVIPS